MSKFSHRLEYAGLTTMRAVFERMSLDRGAALAATLGRSLTPALRRRALHNLHIAMPGRSDETYHQIISGMADHLARNAVEYLHLATLRDTPERITVTGIEHLKAAKAAGRGAVLVTGHFGNWEVVRAACARVDWTPAIIYRRFNTAQIDAEAQRLMQTLDAPIFHKGKRGTLGMLRHIRKGGAAMILCDQRFTGAPPIPFFGVPAKTALAPAEIAMQYGAALIPVRGVRRGRTSTFDVTINAPLQIADKSAIETMHMVNRHLESWITEAPEQYFWLHNRWGSTPQPATPIST